MSELHSAGLDDGRVLHSPGTHNHQEEEEEEEERGCGAGHHQAGLSWNCWLDSLEEKAKIYLLVQIWSIGVSFLNFLPMLVNCRSG